MIYRKRSKTSTGYQSKATYIPTGQSLTTNITVGETWEVCEDFHKKKRRKEVYNLLPPSIFYRDSHLRIHSQLFGVHANWRYNQHTDLWRVTQPPSPTIYMARGSSARVAENNRLALEVLVRTNPFRPEFSIPVFVAEALELGAMFKFAAKTLISFVAGTYLNYKFGWKQFYNDIVTLNGLVDAVLRRTGEFESLTKHGGLRRLVKLGAPTFEQKLVTPVHSTSGVHVTADETRRTVVSFTGSCRWRPTQSYENELRRINIRHLALKTVLDLEPPDQETLWQMLPFSWLVDYFVAVGDFLTASKGEGMVEPFDLCIMRHVVSEAKLIPRKPPGALTMTPGTYRTELKERELVPPPSFPPIRLGFITANQLTTMTALLALLMEGLKKR